MYAVQPPTPPPQPPRRSRRVNSPRRRQASNPYRVVVIETSIKLGVNLALSLAALVALVQLLPFQSNQGAKLDELQAAVKTTNDRVSRIRSNFNHYFDPNQAASLMQEQSHRTTPKQLQVIWQEPNSGY
ncbi:MAG: hypothetical protein ACKO24_19065 [Leptolyngbyaceae cyanobacterium]